MTSLLSSSPHIRSGTEATRLCMRAIGRALEFINMAAAVTKLLLGDIREDLTRNQMNELTFETAVA